VIRRDTSYQFGVGTLASIIKIGESWRALVRRKGHPSYCKTFAKKAQAEAWARQIEADIDKGNQPAPGGVLGRSVLLRDVIEQYRDLRDRSRPISDASNEHYMLRHLVEGLGERDVMALSPHDLVGYCQMRKDEGAGPYTCNMEISKLGTAMRYAGAVAMKVTLPDVVASARPLLKHLGLIGGGGKRERRPTEDELVAVCDWLAKNKRPLFADIVRFAVATAMRRGEIARLTWGDIDAEKRLALVRDRKDPRRKAGNDQWVPLLGQAWEILQQQPKGEPTDTVFQIGEYTISAYFTEACRELAIPDLHFHDLRHEGTSQLFEAGFEIQQVALVTGHKDWRHLRRYTNLRPEDLHQVAAGKRGDGGA
jgi:integrase